MGQNELLERVMGEQAAGSSHTTDGQTTRRSPAVFHQPDGCVENAHRAAAGQAEHGGAHYLVAPASCGVYHPEIRTVLLRRLRPYAKKG
jgi:hypothetical protein